MGREDEASQICEAWKREEEAEEKQSEEEERHLEAAPHSSVDIPPPPAPSPFVRPVRGRRRLSCKSTCCLEDSAVNEDTVDNMMITAKQEPRLKNDRGQFYEVRALSEESPDARSRLESAIVEVASALREDPTIPADPQESTLPWGAATREDVGLVLPSKHCAFRGCSWWSLRGSFIHNLSDF